MTMIHSLEILSDFGSVDRDAVLLLLHVLPPPLLRFLHGRLRPNGSLLFDAAALAFIRVFPPHVSHRAIRASDLR